MERITAIANWWGSKEFLELMKLAIPITLTLVLQQLPVFISLFFVGWIGTNNDNADDYSDIGTEESSSLNLDAAVLGTTVFNITAVALYTGMATAADTLMSQVYGFGNYKRVGVIFQRGLLISLLVTIFVVCILLNIENLLLLLQQYPCVARNTAAYIHILILAYPFFVLYIMLQKFLQTQTIVWPFIIIGLMTNVINAAAHAIFIFGLKLGIEGAAGALVVSNVFQPLLLILYIKLRKLHEKSWQGWSLQSLEEWPEYLKLAVPGTLMMSVEFIGYETFQIVLGIISPVELAVTGIISNMGVFIWMIPYGFSVAIAIRVGNELGKGNVLKAKKAVVVASVTMFVAIVAVECIVLGLRTHIGTLYNAEPEVNRKLEKVLFVFCVLCFADQAQTFLSGIVRGVGHQFYGAIVNQVAFFVFGIPIGIGLAAGAGMGALGAYIGLSVAGYLQLLSLSIVVLCLDWNKEAELAMKRGSDAHDRQLRKTDKESDEIESDENRRMELNKLITEKSKNDASEDKKTDMKATNEGLLSKMINEAASAETAKGDKNDLMDNLYSYKDEHSGYKSMHNDKAKLPSTMDSVDYAAHDMARKFAGTIDITSDNVDRNEPFKPLHKQLRSSISSLKSRLVSRLKLVFIHLLVLAIAIGCLVASSITSFLPFPVSLMNGNYSDCSSL